MALTICLSNGTLRDTVRLFLAAQRYEVLALTTTFGVPGAAIQAHAAYLTAHAFGVEHRRVEMPGVHRTASSIPNFNTVAEARAAAPVQVDGRDALLLATVEHLAGRLGAARLVSGLPTPPRFELLMEDPTEGMSLAEVVKLAKTLPECWDALYLSMDDECCGRSPSGWNRGSLLRAAAFAEAGLNDPLIEYHIRKHQLPQDYPKTGLVEGTRFALNPPKPEPVKKKA